MGRNNELLKITKIHFLSFSHCLDIFHLTYIYATFLQVHNELNVTKKAAAYIVYM